MRTTVTLEADVERMLRDAMHRTRKSFKQTLNGALRTGLSVKTVQTKGRQFDIEAKPMGLRAGVDPAGFNKLADDLEVDAFLEKQARTVRS